MTPFYSAKPDNRHFNHPDYEFLGEISRGGMGVVYRARHKVLNVDRAFKLILADKADLTLIERFEREARTLAELNHPHILKVHGYGCLHGWPFLVTDLIEGSDLECHLKGEGLGLDLAWLSDRLTELASALEYCHERGVTHRDLKPANVIIRRDTNQAVLIDFGLVKKDQADSASLEALSKTGELIGTPEYMAPEQFDNSGCYGVIGPKSDVWSFGVLLYYCLSGRKPFHGSSLVQLCKAVLQSKPDSIQTINEDAPESLVALAGDCLQINGEKRPTMTEVISRLALPQEAMAKTPRWLSVSLSFLFALLFIVVVGFTIYELQDRTPPDFELNFPAKGLYKQKASISGLVFEDGCTVTLNGEVLTVVDRQFQFELPLSEEGSPYKLEVMDSSENSVVATGHLKRVRKVQVGASEKSEFATITEALETVPEDVVIKVEEGIYEDPLILRSNHRIEALDPSAKVVIRSRKRHCITVKSGETWLRGLSIMVRDRRGKSGFHAIVVENGTLTLNDCRVRSEGGHGILVTGKNAQLMASDCKINGSATMGVSVMDAAKAQLENCEISENVLRNARCESAKLRLQDCQLNGSKLEMGLVAEQNSSVHALRCILKGNSSQGARAGPGATLRMEDCLILNTIPAPKGVEGLYHYSGTGVYGYEKAFISLKSCKISGNAGPGVWGNRGGNTIRLNNCEVFANKKSGVELSQDGNKFELSDCNIYENAAFGLRSAGKNSVSLKRVKAWKNKEHGFYLRNGGVLIAQDCQSSSNDGGFVLFKGSRGVFKNCQASENVQSGFIISFNAKFEGLNCQATKNRRGFYGVSSQMKWVGGEIRDNRVAAISFREKSSGLLRGIAMSGNNDVDIDLKGESTLQLRDFVGIRGQLKVLADSSSRLVEDKD